MKNLVVTCCFAFISLTIPLFSTETIDIPSGKSIVVNGGFSTDEWADAGTLKLNLAAGTKITVYFKHDNSNLYIAFCSNLMSTNSIRCPEVLFDVNNDKSGSWMNDDWWFHVSATDCYSKGQYGDYTTCKAIQPDWEANNLIDSDFRDTVEIIIPFSTIGIEPQGIVNLGICFVGTDTQVEWEYWPSGANKSKPSGWAEAVIDFSTSGIDDTEINNSINLYPNPVNNTIQIIGDSKEFSRISIYSPNGNKLYESSNTESLDVSLLPIGLYFIRFESKMRTETTKFVVIR